MVRCAVAGCSSNNKALKRETIIKRETISYFRFPKANHRLSKTWIEKCCRNDQFNIRNSRVCSLHFTNNDFEKSLKSEYSKIETTRRFLKNNAIPTLLLPSTQPTKEEKVDEDCYTNVVIKDEPIDIECDIDNQVLPDGEDSNDIFPKLSAYLQLASNNPSSSAPAKSSNKITTTVAGIQPSPITSESTNSNSHGIKISQPMILNPQQKPQGKISLVPANILLKPQQQQQQHHSQIQLRPQAQHIIYNPGLTGNATLATSGATTAQMPNGMKVLLVNALPKNSVAVANGTPNDIQPKFVTSNTMKANCITSTSSNAANHAKYKQQDLRNQRGITATGSGSGFRSLLSQLVTIQTQTLEVSRHRLELERQRLDFEKSIAERIISALPNFFSPPNNNNETTTTPAAATVATTTIPLLIPKIEKED